MDPSLSKRYLPPEAMEDLIRNLPKSVSREIIGYSVENRPIYALSLGDGPIRVMAWSQMHGNESTCTRAAMDLISSLTSGASPSDTLCEVTLLLVPMLNPDGAKKWSRNNANDIDLNRDASAMSQPETRALMSVFNTFMPAYCLNLHDQRTRYGVGEPPIPATISVLAPAADKEKTITPARENAMKLLAYATSALIPEAPIGIGRYDDTFNADCVGDTFMGLGIPTLLLEAGHYPGDYNRDFSSSLIHQALKHILEAIASDLFHDVDLEKYSNIPENKSCFADIVIQNIPGKYAQLQDPLVLNYKEELIEGRLHYIPTTLEEPYAKTYTGHTTFDLSQDSQWQKLMADPNLCSFFE